MASASEATIASPESVCESSPESAEQVDFRAFIYETVRVCRERRAGRTSSARKAQRHLISNRQVEFIVYISMMMTCRYNGNRVSSSIVGIFTTYKT